MGAAGATNVENVSDAEAMALWRDAWLGGKHGEWGDEPEVAAFPSHRGTWVLARVPIDWMHFDWQYEENAPGPDKQRRAAVYAARSGSFPPGIATLSDRTLRRLQADGLPIRAFVQDGNHRGLAATIRGDLDFSVLMPRQDFERLMDARSEGHSMRFDEGPPKEEFRAMVARMKAERQGVQQALLDAFEQSAAVLLERKGREPLMLILSGEMGPERGYRISVLAKDGPYTHVIASTVPKVVEELGRDLPLDLLAATPASEDDVIAWTDTGEFIEGAYRGRFTMLGNDLRYLAGGSNWKLAHDIERQAIEAVQADGWESGIAILEAAIRELRGRRRGG